VNKKALSLAITLAMAIPTLTNALSLGDIESNSSLNQPFRGKINIHSTSVAEAKSLQVRVASQAVFNRVGIDRPAFLNSIRFRTTIQNGNPVILVSSNQPINEPFLNFLLEVSWPNGQLLKEYTVLLDPPALLRPDTAIASNNAGVRAEPRAQGRITRPVAQSPQQIQQQRAAQQRRVQQQRQAQQARRAAPPTAQQRFNANARRVLANQQTSRVSRAAASTSRTYRVRRGDTLSKIARKLGYRGVRSEQMMVALFEKNRRAFSKNNMNNLKAGVLMKRPSLQEARALSSRKSKAQIAAQAREWKNSRGVVASIQGKKAVKTAANNSQARLTVAGTTGSNAILPGSSAAKLAEQLTMANESLSSKQKENEELKSRVTELESLLRKKNRLITLKSAQLAKLEAGVSGAPEENNTSGEVLVTEAITNEGNDIQQQIANDLAQDNGEIIRNGEDQLIPSEEQEVNQEVNDVISENMEGEEVAVEEESAFVDETASSDTDILGLLSSPTALGIGGGSLLALLGGLWYMRRRKSEEDGEYEEFSSIDIDNQMGEPLFEDENVTPTSIDESEFVAHDEDRHEYMKNSDDLTDNGEEDVLQEADVYIVYGLHDQAESELKQAIENDPSNMAYRAKLLENYKAAGDAEAFENEAKTFMEIDSPDKDKFLENIKEWSNSLNPESKLFSSVAAAGAGVAMVAGTALSENSKEDKFDIEAGLEDFNLDDILSDDDDEDESLIDNMGDSSIDMSDLDDDLDIGDMDDELEEVNNSIQFEGVSKSDTSDELDSIDDLLSDNDESVDIMGDLDLSGDDDFNKDMNLANLNLDIGSDDFEKIMPEDTAYKSPIGEIENNVDSLDNDSEDNLLADFDDNLSFLDLDDDVDEIEETQVDTKLDLAKAYIDMGDIEGARSTLKEVIQDGSEDQKREAEELLHSTG